VSGATGYDVASGALSALQVSGTTGATCQVNDRGQTNFNDSRQDPVSNDGYYYIIRAQATCGPGSYGQESSGLPRLPANACP
jgi:hypothetical protein